MGERKGKMAEITVARPDVAPASGGVAICEVKQACKEPTTPGTPSPAIVWRGRDGGRRVEGGDVGALPAWKLDCLCGETSLPPAVKGGFLYF